MYVYVQVTLRKVIMTKHLHVYTPYIEAYNLCSKRVFFFARLRTPILYYITCIQIMFPLPIKMSKLHDKVSIRNLAVDPKVIRNRLKAFTYIKRMYIYRSAIRTKNGKRESCILIRTLVNYLNSWHNSFTKFYDAA